MPVFGVLLVLGWIAIGGFTMSWLIRRQGDDTPTLIILFVVVYFGVPMLLVPALP